MQKVIPITEAKKLFPDFEKIFWQHKHPECADPESVSLGNPKFCTVRHVVVVEVDENGKPTKALYDKMQIEEGSVGSKNPGAIIIPWYPGNDPATEKFFVGLIKRERPVRNTNALEFPQDYSDPNEETTKTAVRELLEETGLSAVEIIKLTPVCPEPDWFPKAPDVFAAQVKTPLKKNSPLQFFSIRNNLHFTEKIDSGTSLGALVRFITWLEQAFCSC